MSKKSPVTAVERRAYSEVYWKRVLRITAVKVWLGENRGFYSLPVPTQELLIREADIWLRTHIDKVKAGRLAKGGNPLVYYSAYRDAVRTSGLTGIPDSLYTPRALKLLAKVRELVGRKPKFANASATTVSWKWEQKVSDSEMRIYAAIEYLVGAGVSVGKEISSSTEGKYYVRLILLDLLPLTPPAFRAGDLTTDATARAIAADWWEEAGELAKATRLRAVGGVTSRRCHDDQPQ